MTREQSAAGIEPVTSKELQYTMLVIVWPIGFVFAIIKMSFKLSFKRLVEIENKIKLIFEHQYPIKCQKAS